MRKGFAMRSSNTVGVPDQAYLLGSGVQCSIEEGPSDTSHVRGPRSSPVYAAQACSSLKVTGFRAAPGRGRRPNSV
jgi:hypothetical protein